ncbi:MAG: hypothetical protein ACXWH7_12060 [Thermoanaerobaculia bacterium]
MHQFLLAVLLACNTADHRAFDFWLGEWRVEANGKLAGHNTITRSHEGCVLEERWRGASGLNGASLNIYDAATKKWHQTWVDSSGTLLLIDGGIVDGSMRMGNATNRITWSRLDGGRVRQVWEQTTDGKTWTVVFDGTYVPQDTTVRK